MQSVSVWVYMLLSVFLVEGSFTCSTRVLSFMHMGVIVATHVL